MLFAELTILHHVGERLDPILRAVDLLCSLPEVDPARIGVIGHSLGGHNAIFVALFDDRLKAVVSSCGFNDFRHYYKGNIAGWSHKGYMPRLREVYHLDLDRVPTGRDQS